MHSLSRHRPQSRRGCPIQISTDQSLCGGSSWLFAAFHVFHRLQMPRHPPYARYRFVEHTIVVEPQGPAGQRHDDLCCAYALIQMGSRRSGDRVARINLTCDPGLVRPRPVSPADERGEDVILCSCQRATCSKRAGSSCWRGNLDNTPHPAALAGAGTMRDSRSGRRAKRLAP